MGTHPIFESDFDCLTENELKPRTRSESRPITRSIQHQPHGSALSTGAASQSSSGAVPKLQHDEQLIAASLAGTGRSQRRCNAQDGTELPQQLPCIATKFRGVCNGGKIKPGSANSNPIQRSQKCDCRAAHGQGRGVSVARHCQFNVRVWD